MYNLYRVKIGQYLVLVDKALQRGTGALPGGTPVSVYLNQEQFIKLVE